MGATFSFSGKNQSNDTLQVVSLGSSQNVSYTGTAASSTAFASTTTVVRLVSTSDCYVVFGSNPTATTSSSFLPVGVVEYFLVTPGQKVSAIQLSAAGSLNVTECL